ncbi:ImmA/IrrE family metallo-endopeptidase [Acetivibrio clariflavus]|uniref:Putative Zn peptidase n=1 Tax=Acetivibrio clariflavus (strain DSM 19732 / NBRC 101661 / EBR45) TaxID=720554 RepID=G8LXG0_ACECE|nr:ImmA/IrrE family metallo-endopeptidase [Acetivibrio clariflavus]AEV69878.1 putative Zn peptidase [Acetivibrio clariflavus DSM 19732]HPU41771.1 ImmA/IrrE family metallo-endopeptidase [Acetivibrio clariflavus]
MDFKRFKEIIIKNRTYTANVKESIKIFNDKVRWDGNIPKIMKEIGEKLGVLIFQVPLADKDFGAVFLDTGYSKYLLLNSSQPRNKMYFSFCHDIYHILNGVPEYLNEKREVHFNQDYASNDNECKANLFAANLLMPEVEFRKMYDLYKDDNKEIEKIVAKLMNYFSSPFVAVLIRLYELEILEKVEEVKGLLKYEDKQIKELFDSLWLDKDILEPTFKDEMPFLLEMLKIEGTDLVEKQLMSEYNFNRIIGEIEKIYSIIRKKD